MERVEFSLGSSKIFAIFVGVVYLSTIAVLLSLPVFCFLKILGSIFLVWRFRQIWVLHIRRTSKNAITCIWQDPKGRWGCQTKSGRCARGRLKANSFKSMWILVLRFELSARTQSVVIPADALKPFQYRILYARLNEHDYKC